MSNRSRRSPGVEPIERFPVKPRKDGRFQKRINGVLYYFGANGDRPAALKEYDRVKHDLYAGRVPRADITAAGEWTVFVLVNKYLDDKKGEADDGTIERETYKQHRRALKRFVRFVGKGRVWTDLTPDDFAAYRRHLRRGLDQYAYNRERASVVAMFNHADDMDWIDRAPKFGKGFQRIPKGELRERKVERLFNRDDVNALLGLASPDLFAMILLGLNGGYGAKDCAALPWARVDLEAGVIRYKRTKTNIARTVPLWPETVDALKVLRRRRPHAANVFGTKYGNRWTGNAVAHEFAKLAERAGLDLPAGVGIYACRHTFFTYANEVRDTDARRHIGGRLVPNLDDVYVETFFMARLTAVTDHVRSRLQVSEMIGHRFSQ